MNTVRILTVCTAAMLLTAGAAPAADPVAGAPGGLERDRSAAIREFTGAQTRLVWVQDAGETACVFSEKPTLRLMGFDTDDGKGERPILPAIGWYAKPQLTADGKRVVFADWADRSVNVVNFDGTGRRLIVKDVEEWGNTAVWTDPRSGVAWAYASIMEKRGDQQVFTIRRYQIDHPEVNELVWDKAPASHFTVNGDGRFASGGVGEGGNSPQGLFSLPNQWFKMMSNGCWASMSRDDSRRCWVFDGRHRNVYIFAPDESGKTEGPHTLCSFTTVPGFGEVERGEVYHPRWSNHPRFLALTGFYRDWRWASDAKISPEVAAKVEVYLGRFAPDFGSVEEWVRLTDNQRGDYWPDAWVQPKPGE